MDPRSTTQILLLFFLLLPVSARAADLGELRLRLIAGDVQIRTADTSGWTPAVNNFPLRDGDQLWVPEEGLAEVESRQGTIIRLDERTALDILTVDNDALQFYLDMGRAYVNAKGARGTTLQVETPLSSIRAYEQTTFSAEVSSNGDTDISVFLGTIFVENRKGETRVKAGKMLSLERYSASLSPLGRADAWERWNRDQDRILEEQKRSVRYLPMELARYSRDFDNNGEWVKVRGYGFVWRPTVQVAVGWSPYRHGRWVWIGGDYVWIAHESWGWVPYHYGRWSFISRYGWCWVPPARGEVYWGPGYVGWVRAASYVAWVPLAPREIYYGHGYYGPHSVDIRHIDVNKTVVKNVYQNVYIDNSVTIVHNDTFIRGRQVDFKVRENPFLKEKISVGRPQIQPERATRAGSTRDIPKAKEPPDRIKETRVEERKAQRSLVREQGQSVFLPETAPQAMTVEERKEPGVKNYRKERTQEEKSEKTTPQKPGIILPAPVERAPQKPVPSPPPAEARQKPHPGAKDRQPDREEEDRQRNRRSLQPQEAPGEKALPPPDPRNSQPKPSPPPVEARPEERQKSQPGAKDRQPDREEEDRQRNRKSLQPQDAPGEKTLPPPDLRNSQPKPSPAPAESRQKQRSGEEEDRQRNRKSLQPQDAPKEKALTVPDLTEEEAKEEENASSPGPKKKTNKGYPAEEEVIPPRKFMK